MKGTIFTSFLSYVEEKLGLKYLDQMLETVDVKSSGIYTTVGTYDHDELLKYIDYINHVSEHEIQILVEDFGYYLFEKLVNEYPKLIIKFENSLDCIYHIDQTIHRNVRKIHPNAELPNMEAEYNDSKDQLTLSYHSKRPFMYLAKGLIHGCIDYYNDNISVHMIDLSEGKSNKAKFILK